MGRESIARVDGWGYIMGDAGSGYWIGREALDAVMRAYDGRGPQTALTEPVRERWPDLEQAYITLQTAEDRVSIVASFAADVARCADGGDCVAGTITTAAAQQLADSVTTALRGSCAAATRSSPCARSAASSAPGCSSTRSQRRCPAPSTARRSSSANPRGEGIDGTIALADLAPGHPLASAIHRASLDA